MAVCFDDNGVTSLQFISIFRSKQTAALPKPNLDLGFGKSFDNRSIAYLHTRKRMVNITNIKETDHLYEQYYTMQTAISLIDLHWL